jgi:hypothetical protein
MASTFFETVCLSDKERVQSSVIAWIFSAECKAIDLQDKLTALEHLIKPTSKWNNITSMESLVEWEHMDILILLKDNNGVLTDVVVIENKIKCDLHDNQLTRYSSQLTSQYILDKNGNPKTKEPNPYCNATHHYGYLTLIDHKTNVTDGNEIVWKNFTYEMLYDKLHNRLNNNNISDPDYHITKSYLKALKNMVEVANEAIKHPCILFLGKSHSSNISYQRQWDYIKKYKLRHVLQVNYFESIKAEVETDINQYLKKKYGGQTCAVRVSYGMQSDNAEIALDFTNGDIIATYLDFGTDGQGDFCIAVQNGSFKIAAAKDYNDKKKAGNNISLLATRGFMRTNGKDSIFDVYAMGAQSQHKNVKWRVNNPKSNRARMSISRPATKTDVWFEKSNVIAEFKSCIDSLYDML